MSATKCSIVVISLLCSSSFAQDVSDSEQSSSFQWFLGGSLENVFFLTDEPEPGLIKNTGRTFLAPRFSLDLDALYNDTLYFHSSTRLDRGFDPGDEPDGQLRVDEIFLRYRPFGSDRLNIQIGKSPTVFGSYVNEHHFYDDPFLRAPLPYDQIIGVGVLNPRAVSLAAISARANGTAPAVFETPKRLWSATIWGPSYSTGLTVSGTEGRWDYGFEVKNVSLGSHPLNWDAALSDFESPTFSGRVGFRPSHAWNIGVSASSGPYLEPEAERFLPAGLDRGDLAHTLLGVDVRWAHRDWIFSAEVIASEFETLEAGDLQSLSWYVQSRWKAYPGFWLAGRLGQTINNRITGLSGESIEWSPDLWRAEFALGWRITEDTLAKFQYTYTHTDSELPGPGEQLFALGFGWKF